jgi:hypothetical protein
MENKMSKMLVSMWKLKKVDKTKRECSTKRIYYLISEASLILLANPSSDVTEIGGRTLSKRILTQILCCDAIYFDQYVMHMRGDNSLQ